MKFKRLAAALLSAAMIVSLVACSGNEEGSSAYFGIYTLGRYISFASNN